MPHSLPNELQLAALAETGAGRESGRRKLYLSILAVNAAALTLTLFYVWLSKAAEPYVQHVLPALLLLTLADLWWLATGRSLHLAEQFSVYVTSGVTLLQMLVLSLTTPVHDGYVNSGPYWTLAMSCVLAWLFFPVRQALWLSLLLTSFCLFTPWLVAAPYALNNPVSLLRVQLSCVILLLLIYALTWYRSTHDAQEKQKWLLYELAFRDSLTSLHNRRAMYPAIEALLASQGGAILLIDLDHFKQVNDHYGHGTGDEVLVTLAQILEQCEAEPAAPAPTVGRWGGEEFVVVLPGTATVARLSERAELLRAALHAAQWPQGMSITASVGACLVTPQDTLSSLMTRVDQALYHAKAAGRDQAVLAEHLSGPTA